MLMQRTQIVQLGCGNGDERWPDYPGVRVHSRAALSLALLLFLSPN